MSRTSVGVLGGFLTAFYLILGTLIGLEYVPSPWWLMVSVTLAGPFGFTLLFSLGRRKNAVEGGLPMGIMFMTGYFIICVFTNLLETALDTVSDDYINTPLGFLQAFLILLFYICGPFFGGMALGAYFRGRWEE